MSEAPASTATRPPLDPLTAATVTVSWVILLNKPIYPLYVWWLVGEGAAWSLLTVLAAPLFGAIIYIARDRPLIARAALPVVGLIDTIFETWIFGQASGTELFLAACIMLVALSFHSHEKRWQQGLAATFFCAFLLERAFMGQPLYAFSAESLKILLGLNAIAVASLMAFVGLRYAGIRRD